jgi:hypothetical protein
VFGGDVYRQNPTVDADGLLALCEQWLEAVAPRLRRGPGDA